jgi:hypothetical protein
MRSFSITTAAVLLLAGTSLTTAQTMPPVPGGNPATGPASTGPTGGPMSVNAPALTAEQRTQAVTVLRGANIQPVTGVTLAVGQPVPTTVTQLANCPATLQSLVTGVPDCRVVMVGNTYYIVEGGSRRVVTTIAP